MRLQSLVKSATRLASAALEWWLTNWCRPAVQLDVAVHEAGSLDYDQNRPRRKLCRVKDSYLGQASYGICLPARLGQDASNESMGTKDEEPFTNPIPGRGSATVQSLLCPVALMEPATELGFDWTFRSAITWRLVVFRARGVSSRARVNDGRLGEGKLWDRDNGRRGQD